MVEQSRRPPERTVEERLSVVEVKQSKADKQEAHDAMWKELAARKKALDVKRKMLKAEDEAKQKVLVAKGEELDAKVEQLGATKA
jgi:murein L,D-transpeptidase YafK